MVLWILVALQTAPALSDAQNFDLAKIPNRRSAALSALTFERCNDDVSGDEIVICGRIKRNYRSPLPEERVSDRGRSVGEAMTGSDALRPAGRCGIFEGERRCNRQEAAQYGYGNGRDPITVLSRIAGKIFNPEAN